MFLLLWAILPLIKPLFSKSVHLLSQTVTFNQSIRIITDQMKPVSTKLIFSEISFEVAFRCIYILFNAAQRDMECFDLQLQMHNVFIFLA